jgi:hypothetical protein
MPSWLISHVLCFVKHLSLIEGRRFSSLSDVMSEVSRRFRADKYVLHQVLLPCLLNRPSDCRIVRKRIPPRVHARLLVVLLKL